MILQALYELAQAEELIGDPDFEHKPVSWVIHLRDNGELVNIADHRRDMNEGKTAKGGKPVKPKWVGKDELVPVQPIRTSGDLAFFLVDKAEYVLGIDPAGGRPAAKLATRAGLFREAVEACVAESEDEGAKAVAAFLRSIANGTQNELPKDTAANDLFAFKVGEGQFVHLRPAVKAWWKSRREIGVGEGDARYRCLVTGEPIHDVELFPLIKRVPGGTSSGVALVSHNSSAFESYGLSGNDNAPVSRAASQAVATALNRLLDPEPINSRGDPLPRRFIRLSPNTVVVYWSPDGDSHALDAIYRAFDGDDPGTDDTRVIADVYRSVRRGKLPVVHDPGRFFAMTITGTQGRAVIRDWYESTVARVYAELAKYFADLRLFRVEAAIPDEEQSQRRTFAPALIPKRVVQMRPPTLYDVCSAVTRDPSKLPARFALGWWRIAVNSQLPIPADIAARVLDRFVHAVGDAESIFAASTHAAVLKAWLIREGEEMYDVVNPRHPEPAYHCGRMMAVLAEIQRRAIGQKLNAGIIRKYFGAVMSSPGLHLGRLHDLAEVAHLPKIESDRRRERYQDYMREIAMAIGDEVPTTLDPKGQSFFALGFYQQQSHMLSHPLSVYGLRTLRGEWVRSKPEQAIANILRRLGVRYYYEVPIRAADEPLLPDFLVPGEPGRPDTDRYIEYLGMLDRADYRVRWEAKAELYRKHGIALDRDDASSDKHKHGRMLVMTAADFATGGEPDKEKMHRALAEWFHTYMTDVAALTGEGVDE